MKPAGAEADGSATAFVSCGFACVLVISAFLRTVSSQAAGDDISCVTGLKQGLYDPNHSLSSWTMAALTNPCFNQTLTLLTGVPCNGNRVVSLQLGSRELRGVLASSISNCTFLGLVDFSNNHLTGEIHPLFGDLTLLSTLNLSLNHLSGMIPEALANCTYLGLLDLHGNDLSGPIPAALGFLLRLRVLDVSHNALSGLVPYTLAINFSGGPRFNASSFAGNKNLYGYPLPRLGARTFSVVAIVGIGLGSGLLSMVISFTAVCVWLKVSENRPAAEEGKISQLMAE